MDDIGMELKKKQDTQQQQQKDQKITSGVIFGSFLACPINVGQLLFFFSQPKFFSFQSLYLVANYVHTCGPIIQDKPNFVPYHLGQGYWFGIVFCLKQGQLDLFSVINVQILGERY